MAVNEDAKMLMDDKEQKEMGLRISKLREKRGLSQQDMSELLGKQIRRETIKQWENAERHIKAEDIYMLSRFFNVSADYLLGLSDCPAHKENVQTACLTTGLSDSAVHVLQASQLMTPEANKVLSIAIGDIISACGMIYYAQTQAFKAAQQIAEIRIDKADKIDKMKLQVAMANMITTIPEKTELWVYKTIKAFSEAANKISGLEELNSMIREKQAEITEVIKDAE